MIGHSKSVCLTYHLVIGRRDLNHSTTTSPPSGLDPCIYVGVKVDEFWVSLHTTRWRPLMRVFRERQTFLTCKVICVIIIWTPHDRKIGCLYTNIVPMYCSRMSGFKISVLGIDVNEKCILIPYGERKAEPFIIFQQSFINFL